MGFRYTKLGHLMNEDKFAEAAEIFVQKLVEIEINAAATENRQVVVKTNKAAFSRDDVFGANYRTISRWTTTLLDHGFDVITMAKTKLEEHIVSSGQVVTISDDKPKTKPTKKTKPKMKPRRQATTTTS